MSGVDNTASDPDLRAAEYVLGTLDPNERATMAHTIAADADTANRVLTWERRLSPLLTAIPMVTPSPRVRATLLWALWAKPSETPGLFAHDPLAHLRRQVQRWRLAAAGAGLLAVGPALFVVVGSRPGPEGGHYFAAVQGGGAVPALIVRVDARTGIAQVRPVRAEVPAGRSLELWYVGAEGPKPLGLPGTTVSQVTLPPSAALDGMLAVSTEPPGGSLSGQPTGPVVYTGKLVAE